MFLITHAVTLTALTLYFWGNPSSWLGLAPHSVHAGCAVLWVASQVGVLIVQCKGRNRDWQDQFEAVSSDEDYYNTI